MTRSTRTYGLAALALAGTLAGGLCHLLDAPDAGNLVWRITLIATLIPLTISVIRDLAHGDAGVDVIALLAMGGALIGGELLAGVVVSVMLAGGNALEMVAAGRARRELTRLLRSAPRSARRRGPEGWVEVPVDEVEVGDTILVRTGEVIPTDGSLLSDQATLDTSTMTGESLPVEVGRGVRLRSGTVNAGEPFEMRATHPAADSSYATLVRLVEEAGREKPPFTRLADRYAVIFLPITVALAGGAWLLSGEAIRALAVLVVATPCPLILAAPIAMVSGLSRTAAAGIVLKGGTALEQLGEARTVLLDKTGTLTEGRPTVARIEVFSPTLTEEDLLRLAASVDQLSAHALAEGLVRDAISRGLELGQPSNAHESPGDGILAEVAGKRVGVGGEGWLNAQGFATPPGATAASAVEREPGQAIVHVGVAGEIAGFLVMADHLRSDADGLVASLHELGVREVAMVTGDRAEVAEAVAARVGLDQIYADQGPEDKLEVVRRTRQSPELRPVVMVGDGVNDAPALALADVGIAIAGESRTVSSETADAVITVDRIDRVSEAIRIGRRTMAIARQSVVVGIGLSVTAMVFAAFGFIPPVAGALLQEAIDVGVILNALRVLRV